ncbi:NAD-dependent epimerase/dehydratase family protein [Filobacillus milosensis]|uniref:NAD-dependent epimerase/dehydratase family protein n=1 Tax=Filobacillus milosensis TaxID=94137 RepID=A0A4Y8INJ4_9BACI|nr:SDR family oxidoreductase [Filobacillus milosensis]TFB22911.1 NAD-dependent epimerase/dehydratase family protein [Filobacillus milosensis]
MANTYFFTGFPGFIANNLIRHLIRKQEVNHIYLLVLPHMMEKAEQVVQSIANDENISSEQFQLLSGDITQPDLGIEESIQPYLQEQITHVFHLAAIYDLAVPKAIAYNVNVNGTRHVNDWVQKLTALKRYIYFSTAYVSGKRTGKILETELDQGQTFKNHYESTKYEAEVLVDALKEQVPTTIIRPGVVCGDSKTGETIKFDGPYFMLNLFDSLKKFPFIPYIGKSQAYGNFVPVDYIFLATVYLAHAEVSAGRTYHLTDPNPYPMRDVYAMLMEEYLKRMPKGTIPTRVAKAGLSLSYMRKWLRVEKESLDYSRLIAEYDCTQAQQDLKGSGIECPDFKDVAPVMVNFYRENKNNPNYQIHIS